MEPVNNIFLQLGAVGAIALICLLAVKSLFDRLQAVYAARIDAETARADRAETKSDRTEAKLEELNNTVRTEVVRTLTEANHASADIARSMAEVLAAVRKG